jgi:hypothetical protein
MQAILELLLLNLMICHVRFVRARLGGRNGGWACLFAPVRRAGHHVFSGK